MVRGSVSVAPKGCPAMVTARSMLSALQTTRVVAMTSPPHDFSAGPETVIHSVSGWPLFGAITMSFPRHVPLEGTHAGVGGGAGAGGGGAGA